MYNIQDCIAFCLLLSTFAFSLYILGWILNLPPKTKKRNNLFVVDVLLLITSFYLMVVLYKRPILPFLYHGDPFILLFPPALWFVFKMVHLEGFELKKEFWHFLPFGILLLSFIFCLFHLDNEALLETQTTVVYFTTLIQIVSYLVVLFIKYSKLSLDKNKKSVALKRKILLYGSILLALIFVFLLLKTFTGADKIRSPTAPYRQYLFLLVTALIFHWSVVVYWRNATVHESAFSVWTPLAKIKDINSVVVIKPDLDKKESLNIENDEQLKEIAQQIKHLPDAVFVEEQLNLAFLSERIKVPGYLITQAFKTELHTGLRPYVNAKRVEIAKELFRTEQPDLPLHEIAALAGFKSKASFYRVFKEISNYTPRQYQKRIKR